jgi:translocation and assembly module TamA
LSGGRLAVLWSLGAALLPLPVLAQPADAQPAAAEAAPAAYAVRIEGVDIEALRQLLEQVSETRRLAAGAPVTAGRLRRRAEDDRPRLIQALQSRGFYDADVTFDIDERATPAAVTFKITTGARYLFERIALVADPPSAELRLPSTEELGLRRGGPAFSRAILDAEAALLARVKEQGFALARPRDRRAVIDQASKTMDLTLSLDPGPRVRFGPARVAGNAGVSADAIRSFLPWKRGELITPKLLEEARVDLFETNLFSSVRLQLGEQPDEDGLLPITVNVAERKHRSIEAGLRYRSDEGLGGNLGWEHRNVLGGGERLRFALDGSKLGLHLDGEGRVPNFFRRKQALVLSASLADEYTDAFDSRSIGAAAEVERDLGDRRTAALGVAFRATEVEQAGDAESFGLISLPARFAWDRSDDLLDPTRGGRLALRNEPFADVFGQDLLFDKMLVGYSHYLKLSDQPWLVLAGRTAIGTLVGAARDNVPADERFYAGGGGSVRGFGFQLAGELDQDGNPVGGRSLLELSLELRTRFTETIGAAAFVDSGAAFEASFPDFSETMRVGVGTGLRYLSPIGPLRFDVAVPVNRRGEDDSFQIYVSLGQAF